jgi:hypothetical protein
MTTTESYVVTGSTYYSILKQKYSVFVRAVVGAIYFSFYLPCTE